MRYLCVVVSWVNALFKYERGKLSSEEMSEAIFVLPKSVLDNILSPSTDGLHEWLYPEVAQFLSKETIATLQQEVAMAKLEGRVTQSVESLNATLRRHGFKPLELEPKGADIRHMEAVRRALETYPGMVKVVA